MVVISNQALPVDQLQIIYHYNLPIDRDPNVAPKRGCLWSAVPVSCLPIVPTPGSYRLINSLLYGALVLGLTTSLKDVLHFR